MTTKDTDDRTAEAIDFTMMYVTHDAFRRDLGRFTTASAAGTPHAPGVRAGWENFKAQLLPHHSVEDTHLWPRVRRAAAGRPAGLALLDEMEAEHAQIDPLLAVVDRALVGSVSNLAANVAGLASALEWHLKHEEDAALPSSSRSARQRTDAPSPGDAPPPGRQGRGYLRPVDSRRRCTRRAAAVPGRAARPGPGDQPAPLGAALPPAGPVESLTAPCSARPPQPGDSSPAAEPTSSNGAFDAYWPP